MKSANFMISDVFDQVLSQYGADTDQLKDDSAIEATKENIEVDCNKFGLLVLASILGSLSSWCGPSLITLTVVYPPMFAFMSY